MTLQTFPQITLEDHKRMKEGQIMFYCQVCKKNTWHKVFIVRQDGFLTPKTEKNNKLGNHRKHTELYACLECPATKTVYFPRKMSERE